MREITIPAGSREVEDFALVKVTHGGSDWFPALLERWFHLPDGTWACRLRMPGHRAVNGRTTRSLTVVYDPAAIQKLTSRNLGPDRPGQGRV